MDKRPIVNNIAIYSPFFQEIGPHLERKLEKEKDWEVKKSYYVDGPFPNFDNEGKIKSDDGSRELILSYDHTVLIDAGQVYMPIKSNIALHRASHDGFKQVLIMGCDEWLEGPINNIEIPNCLIAKIPIEEHNPTGQYNRVEDDNPRLICQPGLVRGVDIHWFWFFMNELIDLDKCPRVDGITIHSDDNTRPPKRDKKMTEYQNINSLRERALLREKYLERILDREYPPVVGLQGTLYYSCGCINKVDGSRLKKCDNHKLMSPKL